MNYPQYYYPQYVQPMYAQNQQSQQTKPIQNAGFVMVRSEEEAYRYPVAPGNCVTFKVENEPIVIEKSMSFSQLDNPRIDRYRLEREDIVETPQIIDSVEVQTSADELKEELQGIRREIEGIKKKLYSKPNNNNRKQEEASHE